MSFYRDSSFKIETVARINVISICNKSQLTFLQMLRMCVSPKPRINKKEPAQESIVVSETLEQRFRM